MKKFSIFCLLLIWCSVFVYSVSTSINAANRKTAVRCLKISENYLSSFDFENALNQAELGLSYDDSVADLWYIKAAAKSALNSTKAEILPYVVKSLTEGEWVDYNRDGARILYADLLCDTGKYEESVAILDSNPFIYSSDAEFIRTKAYYRINTPDSLDKARNKVNTARKIYPLDMRFPKIFFKYEYSILSNKTSEESDVLVNKIADYFISKMPEYDNPDAELEIYATLFSKGEKQVRMLQAFSAHGMEHPFYAIISLKLGLMSQQEAWDYFCTFADKSININMFSDILSFISDEVTIESVKEHFNAYCGEITFDTNNDCEDDFFVKYTRGRPSYFEWDENNDGIIEWSGNCDFGVPEKISLTEGNLEINYGTYPAIIKVVSRTEKDLQRVLQFNIPDEVLSWTPCKIEVYDAVKNITGLDFFIVNPIKPNVSFDEQSLLRYCSSYEIPSDERSDSTIKFLVSEGLSINADYFSQGKIYAHAEFEDGLPKFRSIDNDNDGLFETIETLGFDPDNDRNLSKNEQEQVMTNLFGLPAFGSGLYVKMIQIDQNADTIPDFTEEYLEGNGKISSWDFDGDGIWNLRYKKYPRENDFSPLVEDSQFYFLPNKNIITVTLWNGEPVKVVDGNEIYPVTKGTSNSFYWLGIEGKVDDEYQVITHIDSSIKEGVPFVVENNQKRIVVVKVGDNIYAQLLPVSQEDEISNEQTNSSSTDYNN